MIPTIEEIIAGMEAGRYSREQAVAWLHSHAASTESAETSDRHMFAALFMNGILSNQNYEAPRRNKFEGMALDAVQAADALIVALRGNVQGTQL